MKSGFVRSLFLATALSLSIMACQPTVRNKEVLAQEGVSSELAGLRRNMISDVSYNISLSIPAEKDSAVTGKETVSFLSSAKGKNRP